MRATFVALLLACTLATPAPVVAQAGARKATTIRALVTYPVFFHSQRVAVEGELRESGTQLTIARDDQSVMIVKGRAADAAGARVAEVRGTFFDVGKLERDDPRVAEFEFSKVAEQRFNREWPGPGELFVIVADRVSSAQTSSSTTGTVRGIALEPGRFEDQRVTVRGRFRGRNLYGDLPDGPGKSRNDFVLQSADAAIWVTGVAPRGRDFILSTESRQDTGTWLEASGIVKQARGLVWIEATEVKRSTPDQTEDTEPAPPPQVLPAPEVVFSAPTQDESDVATDTKIRIQFSQVMSAASFKGHVTVRYVEQQTVERGEAHTPTVEFTTSYDEARRMLEISLAAPLERFRTVEVELSDAITSIGGVALKPWKLSFASGS